MPQIIYLMKNEAIFSPFPEKETLSNQKVLVSSFSYKLVSSVQYCCYGTSCVINHYNFMKFSSLQEKSTIEQEDIDKDTKISIFSPTGS